MEMIQRKRGATRLPINLWRKAKREARNGNCEGPPRKAIKTTGHRSDTQLLKYEQLVRETEEQIGEILRGTDILSDIPGDCTPIELMGEIALAQGTETTIYVERDGLSTLTVVLHQPQPTIANLKRAIEVISRVQLKRELRQRHEERFKRRHRHIGRRQSEIAPTPSSPRRSSSSIVGGANEENDSTAAEKSCSTTCDRLGSGQNSDDDGGMPPLELGTGELVHSVGRNGHHHRPNVSWRYLWRTYALFDVLAKRPVNDANGARLLSECGLENAATVRFCKRENYFGRRRQR